MKTSWTGSADEFAAAQSAATFVRERFEAPPRAILILGSGLGKLAEQIEDRVEIPYGEIPGFASSTAIGHAGRLVCGRMADVDVIAQQGRFHLYEGHSSRQAAFPVRVARALGANTLIVTNAAGGLNPHYAVGDLMLIDDHINLMFDNPLVGVNDNRLGPRFPDMSSPYDRRLQATAKEIARNEGFELRQGVYVAVLGPNYETRAEYRMCRRLGGDAVGMSTAPEVLVARHAEMRVLGLSTITNVGAPDVLSVTTGHDVIANAAAASTTLATILRGVVSQLAR